MMYQTRDRLIEPFVVTHDVVCAFNFATFTRCKQNCLQFQAEKKCSIYGDSQVLIIKYQSPDDLVKVKIKQFIVNHHIDKVHFVMKLAKFTGCIMLITEQNEGLCLSNNSLPLCTQVYCYVHLSIAWQTAPLASSWLLIMSPVINPCGTNFILLLQKVYTNINWQTVFIIGKGARTLCSYCSV